MKFEYGKSELTEFWCDIHYGPINVVVGEAAGGGDQTEWEIIDCSNGEQLAFRRLSDDYTTPADLWPDLMLKAHVLALDLYTKLIAQQERNRQWMKLSKQVQRSHKNIDRYLSIGILPEGYEPTQHDIERLKQVDSHLAQADGDLDLLNDPEE